MPLDKLITILLARLPLGARVHIMKTWAQIIVPLMVSLATVALVAIYTLSLPNQYKSEARVLPADTRGSGGGGMGAAAAAAAGLSLPGSEGPDAVYVDILNGRSLREALLCTKFSFKVRSWYLGSEQAKQETLYTYLDQKNMDRALKTLKDRIIVTRDLKTKLLTIIVETPSPELSQKVNGRLVELLNDFVVTKSQTRGGLKAEFSTKRLEEARVEMAKAQESLRAFLDSNRNYLLSPDPSVRLRGINLDNELKLRTQVVSTLAVGREQALLEEKNDMPILNVLDLGNLPIEKSGPPRAIIVFLAGLFAFLGTIGWRHRFLILSQMGAGASDS